MATITTQEVSAQGTDIQKSVSEGTPMCVLNDFNMQNDARQAHGARVNLYLNVADQPIIAAEEETQGNDQESDGNRITLDADTGTRYGSGSRGRGEGRGFHVMPS